MRYLPLLPALFALAAVPATAQDDLGTLDLVLTVFAGVADGVSVSMSQDTVLLVSRKSPGQYSAAANGADAATLEAVETAPCVFDITFRFGEQVFPVRIDVGLIKTIAFEPGGSMGLAENINPYGVKLTGPEGIAQRINPDGTMSTLSNSPSIATSLTVAELDAAAAALETLCPTR